MVGDTGRNINWGAGEVGGDKFSKGSPNPSLSGDVDRSRLEVALGVPVRVGVFKVDDAAERAIKRPLALGCVCQFRLKT
jgi:hypothetical protein